MKIQSLELKNGTVIEMGKLTVLVGPNNVGKSQTLRDIHTRMVSAKNIRTTIVSDLRLEKPETFEKLLEGIRVVPDVEQVGFHMASGIQADLRSAGQVRFSLDQLRKEYELSEDGSFIPGVIGRFRVSFLDAASRLLVTQATASFDPHVDHPGNLLHGLFSGGPALENKLQAAFRQTFGMEVKLDYSGMKTLSIRVAEKFPEIPKDPREAAPIMEKFSRLDEQGDGFRSFIGVVLSLLLSRGRVVLLDEPEAFLHPAQARQLGNWIVDHCQETSTQAIIATHNAHFLGGILSSGGDVDIFRLNREASVTVYTKIGQNETKQLARSPLLSSQRVLEAIFHKGVVVCEADADRAFYQVTMDKQFGSPNILFIHAHNKQSIAKVVDLLRQAAIPTCVIVDIDLLNTSSDLKKLLAAFGREEGRDRVIELQRQIAQSVELREERQVLDALGEQVSELLEQIKKGDHDLSGVRGALERIRKNASRWAEIKTRGVDCLPEDERATARELLGRLQDAGLFVVPVGELESWIDLGTRRKNKWIVLALSAIGQGQCTDELRKFLAAVLRFMGEGSGLEAVAQAGGAGDAATDSTERN